MTLSADEAFDVTMLAMIEAMADTICQRHPEKTRRWNQARALQERAHSINDTYVGTFPQEFVARAEKFYKWVETDINSLLKDYKGGK